MTYPNQTTIVANLYGVCMERGCSSDAGAGEACQTILARDHDSDLMASGAGERFNSCCDLQEFGVERLCWLVTRLAS